MANSALWQKEEIIHKENEKEKHVNEKLVDIECSVKPNEWTNGNLPL